ncbi:MAG: lysophospholipid acyltransferase family protein [Bacteroidales bacterium]|nr:lysophospholipid acyltransferase family protein [Bacteroidales bacterium]
MHKCLIRSLRYIDVRFLYVFSAIFVIPVCLVLNKSRKTAYYYFRKILGNGRVKSVWLTYVNHCRFAEVVIDKFAMYAGKKFDVEVVGMEHFNRLASQQEGFLHLSSHIGNYEIAGYTLVSDNKVINAVVYAHEKASVMENRNNMFVKTNIRMITLKSDMSHLFEIDQALCNGDIVSFPTDRFMGQAKCVECDFLGKPAKFPQGPFSVATMRGLDVLGVNVMKRGWKGYTIYVTPLQYDKTAPRREQIKQLSDSYVKELEKRVRQYPTQWYNFFEFWK